MGPHTRAASNFLMEVLHDCLNNHIVSLESLLAVPGSFSMENYIEKPSTSGAKSRNLGQPGTIFVRGSHLYRSPDLTPDLEAPPLSSSRSNLETSSTSLRRSNSETSWPSLRRAPASAASPLCSAGCRSSMALDLGCTR